MIVPARDKENSNRAIRLDSYIHHHLSFFPKIADFDHLENTERNKLVLKSNQLVPVGINVCSGKWQILFLLWKESNSNFSEITF